MRDESDEIREKCIDGRGLDFLKMVSALTLADTSAVRSRLLAFEEEGNTTRTIVTSD